MIRGGKVYLTELDRENAETIRGWLNDPEVHRFLLVGHVPITKEQEQLYYDQQSSSTGSYSFEIHVAEDGRYIGNVGIVDVDLVHRHGEVGIAIGDTQAWGQGYGGDAIVACLKFAFLTLGLHSVSIRTRADHTRALELYRRLGFTETGREREHVFQDGRFADYIVFDMLEGEYRALYCKSQ
jgi:RimJ/RimL family protein N-acetyltransferase